ncbi:amidohydrolase [Alteromonas sp. LMIT006]|uniref:amidohydrolase n=1 Tax=Alteromonadaceae TaxID=72275 RepID=UPI0020CA4F9E|nr:amidohydrolase [Alteromonas sp. LMIT006]UTP72690.1 amidohydrolase [Alteromonas sp. LMIT006]
MKFRWTGSVILLFVSVLLGAASASEKTAWVNANGYTIGADGKLTQFRQMMIEDDKIVAIGNAIAIPEGVQVIDAQGKTVLPGLIDAHGHILGLGQGLFEIDLRGTRSEAEAVKRVKDFIGLNPQADWVVGRGWNQVLWDNQQFPSKSSLDALNIDKPIVLSRIDGHASWVNSAALQVAGIDSATTSPSGGEIVKDAQGQPTGLLIDNAMYIVEKNIPPVDDRLLAKYLDKASEHLLSLGITSAHDAGISAQVVDFFTRSAPDLDFRIYAMIAATDPQLSQLLQKGHIADDAGMLSIRSVKVYGDGALGSRGAALIAPYSDDPDNVGLLVTSEEAMPDLFREVIGAGFQLNYHAIGDRANRLGLETFAQTFKIFPENNARHRIEHAQVIAPEDLSLFPKYGIIASMQPTHATSDMNMAEDRLGKHRLQGAYAWQTLLEMGADIAFGSDFPVELANPFHGLHAAITRQNAEGKPKGGWLGHEAVTREQAFKGFTLDAAYAAFQEDMIGSLEVGKQADFIVIDRDIFTVDEGLIRDTQVLETWVAGKRKY